MKTVVSACVTEDVIELDTAKNLVLRVERLSFSSAGKIKCILISENIKAVLKIQLE